MDEWRWGKIHIYKECEERQGAVFLSLFCFCGKKNTHTHTTTTNTHFSALDRVDRTSQNLIKPHYWHSALSLTLEFIKNELVFWIISHFGSVSNTRECSGSCFESSFLALSQTRNQTCLCSDKYSDIWAVSQMWEFWTSWYFTIWVQKRG